MDIKLDFTEKGSHTRLIAESLPHSELVILKGDHFIANKQHEAFNNVAAKFLGK